jgi:ubiquitin fusion degradation protein 1
MMKNNYNAILEYMLRHFPVLHLGDTIPIQFNNKIYNIDIIDLKPKNEYNAVCIIDTELSYDFI